MPLPSLEVEILFYYLNYFIEIAKLLKRFYFISSSISLTLF